MAKNNRRQEEHEEEEFEIKSEFDMGFVIIPLAIFLVMGFFTI